MRIITLTAENVKRLRAVEITPDGNVVVIAGKNAQGKSSVLDAIWMALAGGTATKDTSRPIRDGEHKAHVTLDLGDLIVTRKWTPTGSTLEVAARDGAKYSTPQTILDSMIGRLTFDPFAFAQQDQKGQLATLLGVIELPFDPAVLEESRREIYENRTDVNRDVKRLEAQLEAVPEPPADAPTEEASAAGIAAELQVAQDDARVKAEATVHLQESRREADRLTAEVARVQEQLAGAERDVQRAEKALGKLPEPADVEPIKERLAAVDATNAVVRAAQSRARIVAELATARAESVELTGQLDEIDGLKAKAIAEAAMPLDGLSFDDEGVLYQGVPFSQASASERLRVGVAMAMALNPQIRVIRITDGSLLDSESMGLIEQMADEHDFQVWIERVDETGTVGITIEDGAVVGDPEPEEAS